MIVSQTKLSYQALFHSFDFFTSVQHGKKLQNVEAPFGIIEVYSKHSQV